MIPETFSLQWFTVYYFMLGILFLALGVFWLTAPHRFKDYLLQKAEEPHPPLLIRQFLKYFLLFTIPCVILSFLPFSWVELLFSIWSLWVVYVASLQLVRWDQTRLIILDHPSKLEFSIRTAGALTLAVSLVIFLLGYLIITRMNAL